LGIDTAIPSLAAKVSGKTLLACLTRADTLLYLALKWVRASLLAPAFLANSAASSLVECFLSTAFSLSPDAKVESKMSRSTPAKNLASVAVGLVSPE